MTDIDDVRKALLLIKENPDCLAWEDFKDKGTPCIDWFALTDEEERDYLITKANVEYAMQKRSSLYKQIEQILSAHLGNKWITYDWAVKAIARAIAFSNYNDFYKMLLLSRVVRDNMKKKRADPN